MNYIQAERLLSLAAHLRSLPAVEFDMHSYAKAMMVKPDDMSDEAFADEIKYIERVVDVGDFHQYHGFKTVASLCGTTACALGHASTLWPSVFGLLLFNVVEDDDNNLYVEADLMSNNLCRVDYYTKDCGEDCGDDYDSESDNLPLPYLGDALPLVAESLDDWDSISHGGPAVRTFFGLTLSQCDEAFGYKETRTPDEVAEILERFAATYDPTTVETT